MSATEIMTAFKLATATTIIFGSEAYATAGLNTIWTFSGTFTGMSIAGDYTAVATVSGTLQVTGDVVESTITTA